MCTCQFPVLATYNYLTDVAKHKLSQGGLLAGLIRLSIITLGSIEVCEHCINLWNGYSAVAKHYDIKSLGARCTFYAFSWISF